MTNIKYYKSDEPKNCGERTVKGIIERIRREKAHGDIKDACRTAGVSEMTYLSAVKKEAGHSEKEFAVIYAMRDIIDSRERRRERILNNILNDD
jgi:hypothetical protein